MRQKIDRFTRRLSDQELVLGCLILLPLFFYCNSYIGSAIVKWTILTFNLSITSTNANIWLNFVVDLITALIAVIILRKFIMRQWKDFMNNKLSIIVAGCFLGFFLNICANAIGSSIVKLFVDQSSSVNQQQVESLTKSIPAIMFFVTGFLAPIGEELIFRGIIFTGLRKYNRFLAYVVTAFLFGFIHVMNSVFAGNIFEMVQMIPYACSGLVFAYIYESTDNIWASILTHMTNNIFALLVILF